MCYLRLFKQYSMRHYSQNVQMCVIPDILLLHQSMHRVSITFLWKTMRMGMMGVHPSGLHHLGDMCLIRHLCLDHRLKTRAKVETLIPQFHWNHNPPGSTPSESSSDDFYAPKTPSQRSPSKDDPNSSHGFFDPNSSCFNLYDKRTIYYKDREDPSTLSRVRYHYMRHGRQLSWD